MKKGSRKLPLGKLRKTFLCPWGMGSGNGNEVLTGSGISRMGGIWLANIEFIFLPPFIMSL
jgi:hypothetical protein